MSMREGLGLSRRVCLGSAALLAARPTWSSPGASTPQPVRYLPPEAQNDRRPVYPVRLLALALAKAGGNYQPEPAQVVMNRSRAVLELARGSPFIDVLWATTSREREQQLLPVRLPIDRGLLGWRLALLPKAAPDRLKDVRSLDQLKQLVAGQGHDWTDLEILRANGLTVEGVSTYGGLFRMLAAGRIDYLPRGITELGREAGLWREADLVVDRHIALHYPAAAYFFVSPKRPELAEALHTGLERAMKDGSFAALFREVHEPELQSAHVARRRVFELHNPLLPPETPLHRPELWWRPEPAKAAKP